VVDNGEMVVVSCVFCPGAKAGSWGLQLSGHNVDFYLCVDVFIVNFEGGGGRNFGDLRSLSRNCLDAEERIVGFCVRNLLK